SVTPAEPSSGNVTITVMDSATPPESTSKTLNLTINPAGLTIITTKLHAGAAGSLLNTMVTGTGGTGAYQWSATGLPSGLTINAGSGAISATPGAPSSGNVTITVTDSATPPVNTSKTLNLTINNGVMAITTTALTAATTHALYS